VKFDASINGNSRILSRAAGALPSTAAKFRLVTL